MASVFDYIFNIGGNFTAQLSGMSATAGEFTARVEGADKGARKLAGTLATFSYLKDVAQNVADGFGALSEAGLSLDSQLHDLSAVAGVAGDGLKEIERFARESALAFGTDASESVEGYKLLLSQLSPELGKYPEALSAMGACIQTTSKLMGGDGVAAAEVLTTAMNQYGVSLEDPMAASGEMARMMNVMAAAGQAGSAELPAISAALSQCGMAAKAANVSFEETNAAIQVLDKAGKKASEGGVALRNVLGQLGKGRFIEKEAAEELAAAGIDVVALADDSKTLKERLDMLKPLLNDSALLSKFFGVENANAARALIQGTDALEDFTEAVTGTNSAEEQAAIVMDSYVERQARVNQKIEDMKISLFEATGDLSIWCSTLSQSLVPLAQLAPALTVAGDALGWFGKRLIAGGGNATTFAQMASGSFMMFSRAGVAACREVSVAIGSIPIVGWIAILISALGYLCVKFEWARYVVISVIGGIGGILVVALKLLYDRFYSVRLVILTWIELIKAWWAFLYRILQNVIAAVSDTVNAIVERARLLWEHITVIVRQVVERVRQAIESVKVAILNMVSFIRSAISAAMVMIERISAPVAEAFQGIAQGIKNFFIEIFDWIYDKYSSFINTIINLYNKLAEQLGWDKIKALGKQAADRSWASDHPAKSSVKGTTKGTSGSSSGVSVSPASSGEPGIGIPDPIAGTLSKVSNGGSSAAGTADSGGKIRNVTINIDRLIERLEIHTTTLSEGTDRMKEMVVEALAGALNDVQIATE